jgi:hypothetical protein
MEKKTKTEVEIEIDSKMKPIIQILVEKLARLGVETKDKQLIISKGKIIIK